MRIRRTGAIALAVVFGLFTFAGCKDVAETETQTPQPTQTMQVGTGNNPFTVLVVEQTDQKDSLLGEMGFLLDSYQPKENETDYTGLAVTVLTPFSEVDGLLSDVLVLSFCLQTQQDGRYSYNHNGQEAALIKDGQSYEYSGMVTNESDAQSHQRQSAHFAADGSRMTLEIYDKANNRGEIRTLFMQWVREDDVVRVQCHFTINGGESYDILRYQVEDDALIFAIYEQVESAPDLFALSSEELFEQGYVTYGIYANGTATIQNEDHTLVVGP